MTDKTQIVNPDKIYAIKLPGSDHACTLAMNVAPDYNGFNGICYLTPPDHPHMIEGKLGKKTKRGFTFMPDAHPSGEWEFIEATYEDFCREYYKFLIGGKQVLEEFHSTEEMENYYHKNFPDYGY